VAEYVGQEWTAPDGQLWRVTQVREQDGTFAQDDPTTPERESATWAAVEVNDTTSPAEGDE
jgi:hypothetical protein